MSSDLITVAIASLVGLGLQRTPVVTMLPRSSSSFELACVKSETELLHPSDQTTSFWRKLKVDPSPSVGTSPTVDRATSADPL